MTLRTSTLRPLLGLALVVAAVLLGILALTRTGSPEASPNATSRTPGASTRSVAPTDTTTPTSSGKPAPSSSDGAPTDASPARVAVLVGAGDIADCSEDGDTATAELLQSIDGTVFTLGDNAYEDGTLHQFQQCYGPTWGRPSIKDRTRPAPGNHDYHTHGAPGYFEYFGAAAGDPNEGWYAYDAGTWRVYVLNSNCDEIGGCHAGSSQERWLRDDLAANPRDCVAAMWHHPRFSSGAEHGNDPVTTDLWLALQEAGAELVVVGHEHMYERFGPQTANGEADDDHGLVQFVVGTGGRHLYPLGDIQPNSLVRDNHTFGVLELTLEEGGYAFEFVPVAGRSFTDAGSGTCH